MLGLIGEAISLRSFASLWYWVALVVFWVWVTGRLWGIPYGLVHRAGGDEAGLNLLQELALAQAGQWRASWQRFQILWVAGLCAALVALARLAFHYNIELAQALWFLALPYVHLLALNLRAALRFEVEKPQGEALLTFMYRRRISLQILGFVYIFVTVVFAFFYLLIHAYFR